MGVLPDPPKEADGRRSRLLNFMFSALKDDGSPGGVRFGLVDCSSSTSSTVQAWSDTQIVAQVASGSASGNALVLQNGVMSNPVPFAVNTLQLTTVSPNSGAAGTSVTFTGAGFGSSQGSGVAWLGSAAGQVVSWSDAQVVATVASAAVTGIARIQQNGAWSNALAFTVPSANGVTLMPSVINMMVGDTHAIQALSAAGQPVTGLTWTSSDPTVVSLSTDDPPLLTALAAGHVTITAGTASADVTVSDPATLPGGALPLGTVLWSHPGDVYSILPAVPSPTGVADVFALQNDGTVQAITSDGTTAWAADVSDAGLGSIWPDFQGGLVVYHQQPESDLDSLVRLDGVTGQPVTLWTALRYNASLVGIAVHTDGTVFAVEDDALAGFQVLGFDAATGAQKFSLPVPMQDEGPAEQALGAGPVIIAGDGYAYVPYEYGESGSDGPSATSHLHLLQISSSGASTDIPVYDSTYYSPDGVPFPHTIGGMITNADTGIVLTFTEWFPYEDVKHMAIINGTGVSIVGAPDLEHGYSVAPVLQLQDGSFVGTTPDGPMVAFDTTGGVRWTANDYPLIATADGGVIGQSGIVYDQNGSATGQIPNMPTYSWPGNSYQSLGALESIVAPLVFEDGASFWPALGGNPSGNGTAVVQCPCLLQSAGTAAPAAQISPSARAVQRRDVVSQKTYLVMAGDPGLNLGDGHDHNVGGLFNLAAETRSVSLTQAGNNTVISQRVSSFADFNAALTANGPIDGDITYFGHAGLDSHRNPALFPGQYPGDANNVSIINVGQLSNAQLGQNVTITLNACHAGYGGRSSVAQLLADKLGRTVLAYPVDMYFSSDPTPRAFKKGMVAPSGVPTYMVPNGDGTLPIRFPLH